MNVKRALVMAAVAVLMASGLVQATPPAGLSSSLQARGSWDQHERNELARAISKMNSTNGGAGRNARSDVFVVRAELAPGGTTGWHRHTGPSVIVIASGELTIYWAERGKCVIHHEKANSVSHPGGAFFHTADTHTFVNHGSKPAVFFVTYFAPSGPLLLDADDPGVC